MTETALEARGVSKFFPGVKALQDVSLRLAKGSIHALLGENGAGKSTLIKIITGVYRPDEGDLLLDGAPGQLSTPRDAMAAGIGVVHQERNLIPRFSVGENIMLEHLAGRLCSRSTTAGPRRGQALARRARPRPRSAHAGLAAQRRQDAARGDRQGPVAALARAAARRADRLADAARDRGAVRAAAQAARRGRRHALRQPQARGGAGDLRRGDGAARRSQRLREPDHGGARAAGSRAPDDRPQRADPGLERARPLRRAARAGTARRRDPARPSRTST